jgi:hypothetical protein
MGHPGIYSADSGMEGDRRTVTLLGIIMFHISEQMKV